MELLRGLFPAEVLCPLGEEKAKRIGAPVLARGPRNLFDGDRVTAFAVNAAHAVEEPHGDVPEGHEVK